MNKTRIFNFISAVFMGILLILQFMPFWNYDGLSTSIQSYVWFPSDHVQLDSYIIGHVGEFTVSNIIVMPIAVLILTVIGIVLCVWKSKNPLTALLPLACGLVGIWGYLFHPAMQLGTNWVLHLVVCIAMAASSALTLVLHFKNN